ncbi:MAG: divergent polysaccharide deacetylase family protein [Campylobacterales bacterium]|nr:divergent polysaccharide deacetylase family protein [Campylobacterales bacterium]
MAPPAKRPRTGSPQKSKKQTRKKQSIQSDWKKHFWVVSIVGLMILMVMFGYYLGQHNQTDVHSETLEKQTPQQKETEPVKQTEVKGKSQALPAKQETKPQIEHEVEQKTPQEQVKEANKTKEEGTKEKTSAVPLPAIKTSAIGKKPKLVIVIDDVSHAKQLEMIHSSGLKLTPSIFPPSELSYSSNELAKDLKHYMVHLPMESGSTKMNTMHKTLMLNDTPERIRHRVEEIRKLFPNARYMNNHTGSVYTADTEAMEMLYGILRENGFIFVDSRTSAKTKVKEIAHRAGDIYIYRDVFLDNVQSSEAIRKQLLQAVKTAYKNGNAIAIGHPHPFTLQTLKNAEDILQKVELVYIDELFAR